MANQQHIAILRKGVKVWNQWRNDHLHLEPDLSGANLVNAELPGADLRRTYLIKAKLQGANLRGARISGDIVDGVHVGRTDLVQADLTGADLRETDLRRANLFRATLIRTDLRGSNLSEADLSEANLREAKLAGADLRRAQLVNTCLKKANLNGCKVFGIATWNLDLEGAEQSDLVITPQDEPDVTVDDLEVAQFVYLLLNNKKIRNVLDTIAMKGVLILGRFTPQRKNVLDRLRERLRELNYVPMMFDFEGAKSKDFTETVKILAGMSRFIIADITNPKSSPLELQATVPDYMVPFVPIIQEDEDPFSMFVNLQNKYDWVLDVLEYKDAEQLIAVIDKAIIQPALAKEDELIPRKTEEIRKRRAEDYH